MAEAKHTPGPWKAWQRPGEKGTNYWRIRTTPYESDGDTLCGYCGEANARLIVNAPELYEALEALLPSVEEAVGEVLDWPEYERAKAVLAKVRGEAS